MIKVGLLGGRGYVGEELLKLFQELSDYEVVYAGSRGSAGKRVCNEYAALAASDLTFSDLSPGSIQGCNADAWIIAQSNGQAAAFEKLLKPEAKVVDISSDFRFDDSWTYGLAERNADSIVKATRVANPGCYATATQLALLPLLDPDDSIEGVPVAFGISGYSGAGRTPNDKNDPTRLKDNLVPYSLTGHTHELEISHQVGKPVRFMPHVTSFFRGISITMCLQTEQPMSVPALLDQFSDYYSRHSLIEVQEAIPEIAQVRETNRSIIGGFAVDDRDPRRVTIVCVIDNLRKGAASQAIQNLNLMFGMESERGLA